MDLQQYKKIMDNHGGTSSWCVFPEQGKTLNTLNPNIILVGLNISNELPELFSNFHSGQNDYKIRYATKNTMFWGSYMTDILKNYPEKNSQTVDKYLKSAEGKLFEQQSVKSFEQELIELNISNPKNPKIVLAFGKLTFDILKRNFPHYNIHRVTHYSYRRPNAKEQLRAEFLELEKQLLLL